MSEIKSSLRIFISDKLVDDGFTLMMAFESFLYLKMSSSKKYFIEIKRRKDEKIWIAIINSLIR